MIYLYLLLILLSISTSISFLFHQKIEKTLFLSIFTIVIIEFFSGYILNNLKIGFYIILLIFLLSVIYNIYRIIGNKTFLKKYIFTNGFYIFLLAYCIIIVITYNKFCIENDAFSHWTLIVKNMFNLNTFAIDKNATINSSYPQGISLFQYFVMNLNGKYSESILYTSIDLTMVCLILSIIKSTNFKNQLLNFIFIILFPIVFSQEYANNYIMVDTLLSVTFFVTITKYIYAKNKFDYIIIIITSTFLIMIKDFGIILLLIFYLYVILNIIFNKTAKSSKTFLILLFIIPMVIKLLWLIIVKEYNVGNVYGASVSTFSAIINIFTFNLNKHEILVTINFIKNIFAQNALVGFIEAPIFILLTIYILLIYLINKKLRSKKIKNILIFLGIGLIIYMFILLSTYLNVFDNYESTTLASYTRYINTYILSIYLTTLIIIITNIKFKYKNCILISLSIYFIIVALYSNNINKKHLFFKYNNNFAAFEKSVLNIKKNQKIYFVSQGIYGNSFRPLKYFWLVARYKATPIKLNNDGWILGTRKNEYDTYTVNKDVNDLRNELLNEYDYLYIFTVNQEFKDLYGELFNVQNNVIDDNQLYIIKKNVKNHKILYLVNNDKD